MATELNGVLELTGRVTVATTQSDVVNPDLWKTGTTLNPEIKYNIIDGAAAGVAGTTKAQKHYHKKHTITVASPLTLDMNALADERGNTINFAKVVSILLRVRTTVTAVYCVVGNAASDPWAPWLSSATATENVHSVLWRLSDIDGWTVPAAANLKFQPVTATMVIDVSFIGY